MSRTGLTECVLVAAVWAEGLAEHESIDETRTVYRIRPGNLIPRLGKVARALNLLIWMYRVVRVFKDRRVVLINCHSLLALIPGVAIQMGTPAVIIYDPHELETEKDGWGPAMRAVGRILERLLVQRASAVVAVSDSIGNWYARTYRVSPVHVVRNVSYMTNALQRSTLLKERLGIGAGEILFIFQGSLSFGRGVELLGNAFSDVSPEKHIVFLGFGDLESWVKELAASYANIHFHPAVGGEELLSFTSSADVGFNIAEPTCTNHLYSLPNKIFEYIGSGLPIIVSDFPDMGHIVDEHDCGWKVDVSAEAVVELVNGITADEVTAKRQNTLACRHLFDWEKEIEPLLATASEILKKRA